jgi:hypothetical protein
VVPGSVSSGVRRLIAILACVSCAAPVPRSREARLLLGGAERALGPAARGIRTLRTLADVTSPAGAFRTEVVAHRDGRARLVLGAGLRAGIDESGGWMCDSGARRTALDPATRTVVRGHELHMLAVAPSTRLRDPVAVGDTLWDSEPVHAVAFRDDLGARVTMYLRERDTLPVGFDLVNHTGEGARRVELYFSGWVEQSGARLFRRARFVHGGMVFDYAFTRLEVDGAGEADFRARC